MHEKKQNCPHAAKIILCLCFFVYFEVFWNGGFPMEQKGFVGATVPLTKKMDLHRTEDGTSLQHFIQWSLGVGKPLLSKRQEIMSHHTIRAAQAWWHRETAVNTCQGRGHLEERLVWCILRKTNLIRSAQLVHMIINYYFNTKIFQKSHTTLLLALPAVVIWQILKLHVDCTDMKV
jgi:hypothetical protein